MSPQGGGAEPHGPGARPPAGTERQVETTMSFAGLVPVETHDGDAGLSADEKASVDALPPGSALLIVRRGPNTGARFLLDAPRTSAGRHPSSDIFLDDVTVSRRHAEFVRGDDTGDTRTFRVRDVGSLNGTYVDRERIDEKVLRTGDEVQIGKFRMVFHASRRSDDPPAGGSGR